jgi:hypothetical protein
MRIRRDLDWFDLDIPADVTYLVRHLNYLEQRGGAWVLEESDEPFTVEFDVADLFDQEQQRVQEYYAS